MADKEKQPDLELIGKVVWYYPNEPTANTISAPRLNADGTPHAGWIYNARADETVDIAVWANGAWFGVEHAHLWKDGESTTPIAVFPTDDKKRIKVNADAAEKEAKVIEGARVKAEAAEAKKTQDEFAGGIRKSFRQ